jgi:hypothetical protein
MDLNDAKILDVSVDPADELDELVELWRQHSFLSVVSPRNPILEWNAPVPGPVTHSVTDTSSDDELELIGAGEYQTAYINLRLCIETFPCKHYVRYANGAKVTLNSNEIRDLFTERGLPAHSHFN